MSKKKHQDKTQIESVGKAVLANLSIEELEQRLEMQILAIPAAPTCGADCKKFCSPIF